MPVQFRIEDKRLRHDADFVSGHDFRRAASHAKASRAMEKRMNPGDITQSIRESYDRLADEYARHFANELQNKPFDREQLNRFAAEVAGRGEVCDMGCGPGHIARYLRDAGAKVFGLDLSPRMVDEARRLNPDMNFREGNMLALDLPDAALAGIV